MRETGQAFSIWVRLPFMTLKAAQVLIINQLFLRQEGSRRKPGVRSEADGAPRMPPAALARQAWRRLQHQGLIDARGRLTLSGLAVAVGLRARARQSAREVSHDGKPASVLRPSLRERGLPLAA